MNTPRNKTMYMVLPFSFLFLIIFFISFGVVSRNGIHSMGQLTRQLYDHPLVVSNASLYSANEITKIHRDMKDIVLESSSFEIESKLKEIERNEQNVYIYLNTIKDNILGEEGLLLEQETRILFIQWKPIREDVISFLLAGKVNEAIAITKQSGADHVHKLETKMFELSSYARIKASSFQLAAEKKQQRLELITLLITILGVAFSLIIIFITLRLVFRSHKILEDKNNKIQNAYDEISLLRGILPICVYCKNIRNDDGYYEKIEGYIHKNAHVDFSHTICPTCMKKHYPEEYKEICADNSSEQTKNL